MEPGDSPSLCPTCGNPLDAATGGRCESCEPAADPNDRLDPPAPFLSLPQMRYQDAYVWLVLISTLDIILTWLVLTVWDGYEVNPIASAIIAEMGFTGAIIFKFAIVVLVVVLCEVIGRGGARNDRTGRALSIAAVGINAIPVAYTFGLIYAAR